MRAAETSADIEQAAAEWVARAEGGALNPVEEAELQAWLAGDDRRLGAYVRAQAAWVLLDRARALPLPSTEASAADRRLVSRRRLAVGAGCAAAAATAIVGGFALLRDRPGQRVETALGESRKVPLEDGSAVFLNTATAVDVRFRKDLRLVSLQTGEAWFDVAKDARRPFHVEAGRVGVRAVGTAFSVHRDGPHTTVIVTEGVVQLSDRERGEGGPRLKAGMKATIDAQGVIDLSALAPGAVGRSLAWREGWIALGGETVQEAAATFNRYNLVKLVVADPAIAAEPVVGWFREGDPHAFARAVGVALGARVEVGGDRIVLRRP